MRDYHFQPGNTESTGRPPGSPNKRTNELRYRLQNRGDVDNPTHACSAKLFAVNFSGFPTIKYLCGITISNQEILKARSVLQDPRINERMNCVIGSKTVVMLILLISVHR